MGSVFKSSFKELTVFCFPCTKPSGSQNGEVCISNLPGSWKECDSSPPVKQRMTHTYQIYVDGKRTPHPLAFLEVKACIV